MNLSQLKARLRHVELLTPTAEGAAARGVERWELVIALLELQPFPTRRVLPRSEQWRDAAARVRDVADCRELVDWAIQQAEIARNLERGVRDMRPRKDGPCHALLLEHARVRLRKANVVLTWLDAARDGGADLMRGPSRVFTSEQRPPPKLGNPLVRNGSLWEDDVPPTAQARRHGCGEGSGDG